MAENKNEAVWLVYYNAPALLWDVRAVSAPFEGPCGSNWHLSDAEEAASFAREMEGEGEWTRGHTHGYTY